jgi:quercetin dioxygenase-like cupin family protein
MRPNLLAAVIPFLLIPIAAESQEQGALPDTGPTEHLIYTPDDIQWQPGPGSFQPGAEFAVLEGDPSQPGVFTMQIRMPDGFVIAPHWHPGVERVTVLSGAFHLGHGDTLDRQAAQRLPAGSHFSLPPQMRHYAITEGETVVQLSSIGPWEITYVDPEDDPRGSNR